MSRRPDRLAVPAVRRYSGVMKLRLHTRHRNSAGERVRIVLNLKGVPYEYVAIPSLSWRLTGTSIRRG